jgi:hypothetical protein
MTAHDILTRKHDGLENAVTKHGMTMLLNTNIINSIPTILDGVFIGFTSWGTAIMFHKTLKAATANRIWRCLSEESAWSSE